MFAVDGIVELYFSSDEAMARAQASAEAFDEEGAMRPAQAKGTGAAYLVDELRIR